MCISVSGGATLQSSIVSRLYVIYIGCKMLWRASVSGEATARLMGMTYMESLIRPPCIQHL